MSVIRDTAIVYTRELRPSLYEPLAWVFTVSQPLVFLLLFGPLLEGVPGSGDSPWQWFVPGILIMLALSGTTTGAGYSLLLEMQTGSHERLLVTPLKRSALLVGRALKDVVQLLAQSLLIIVVVIPVGFDVYPVHMLVGLVLLGVFGIGLGALSYALAIAVRNQEWIFWTLQQMFLFPILILSGVLLPLDMGPAWMRTLSKLNPLTYLVEMERALFAGDFNLSSVLAGSVMVFVIAGIGLVLGIRAMRQASS